MIYFKINKRVYQEKEVDKLKKDFIGASDILAINRVINNTIQTYLKDYPEIDIVISNKRQKRSLGRFCLNNRLKHKEYKFIKQGSGNPYIVLFIDLIFDYFFKNKIKGIQEVFLHEFFHYRQWLLSEKLGHNLFIKAIDNPKKVDYNLNKFKEVFNNEGIKQNV